MPRFYFDVREGKRFTPDGEDLEFESLDIAEREAAAMAAEIGRDRLPKGEVRQVTVEVRNEHHQRVRTVTIVMEIHQGEPALEPPHT